MNMPCAHGVLVAFLLAVDCAAMAQDARPPAMCRSQITRVVDCAKIQVPSSALESFEDELTGIRFQYPAYISLNTCSLLFENPPCGIPFAFGGNIGVKVSLASRYQAPVYVRPESVAVEAREVNGLEWNQYRTRDGRQVQFCTFADGEEVCIFAGDTSPKHHLPQAAVDAMEEIEATFGFTDPALRMDAKIAAIKIGEKVRALKVRRVITREMMEQDPGRYEASKSHPFGELDFEGELRLKATIQDIGTMNIPGQYRIFPDREAGPQLPFYIDRNLAQGINFNYPPALKRELIEIGHGQHDLIVTVKNIHAIFGPIGGGSSMSADLVSVEKTPQASRRR